MNAKQMFEALGFKQTCINHRFIEYKRNEAVVFFNKKDKEYFCYIECEYDINFVVSIEEHKAITQQMKELGCIND